MSKYTRPTPIINTPVFDGNWMPYPSNEYIASPIMPSFYSFPNYPWGDILHTSLTPCNFTRININGNGEVTNG